MSGLRKLAGQTALYGLSSIIGRFFNYLLTPLYTSKLVFQPEQYGIITEMYAYVAFLVVALTYGMETAFFRFYAKDENRKSPVYSTAVSSLLLTSSLFILVAFAFSPQLASALGYPNNVEYITWFAIIVGLDALVSIPMAKLRAENKAVQFASINFAFIFINIGLNLFFLAYCMPKYKLGETNWLIETFYDPETGVGYVFISNLIASICRFLLLAPSFLRAKFRLALKEWGPMLKYALPLLIAGLAGIVNETLDRALLKWMLLPKLGEEATMAQIGIYGACYKLSIIITLFIQAYRYAAEPFFFNQAKHENSRETYARLMNYFVIVILSIFLMVTLFIDFFKYFIPNPAYWEGLTVVPILLIANFFLGVYYNQSVWYKLSDKTMYGSYIAILGALVTIGLNLLLIPVFGYVGSAWATLACYFSMVVASFVLGHRFYPIPYKWKSLVLLLVSALGLYFASEWVSISGGLMKYLFHLALLSVFLIIAYKTEPLNIKSLLYGTFRKNH